MTRIRFGLVVLFIVGALGVAVASQGVSAPPTPSVQVRDAQLLAHLSATGGSGQPAFLAQEPNGNLVVADRLGRRILRFDQTGNQISQWGPLLGADVELHDPGGVAATSDAWYILDRSEPWILRLDATGTVQSHIDLSALGLYGPNGLTVDSVGTLYLADTGGNRILIFGSDGHFIRSIGTGGNERGQLRQPITVAPAPGGGLIVADWENSRLERWGPDLQATDVWTTGYRPWGVAVDSVGRVYTVNTDRRSIDVFTPTGDYLTGLNFNLPGVAVEFPNQLVVAPDASTIFVLGHDGVVKLSLDQGVASPPRPSAVSWLVGQLPGLLVGLALGLLLGAPPVRRLAFVRRRRRATGSGVCPSAESRGSQRWFYGFWSADHQERTPLAARWTVAAIVVIVGVALLLRVLNLSTLPIGLHGDEGATGLEAQRIMHEVWIGPYSPEALGRPSGPMYLAVPAVAILGNTIAAVRIMPALVGALSVLVLFWLVRANLGTPTALVGAGLLALMNWNIHLSRLGFNLSAWGLLTVLCAWALLSALRRKHWGWWVVAGALAGAGVYIYQAHLLLLPVLAAFLGILVVVGVPSRPRRQLVLGIGIFGVVAVVAALPMLLWAADPANGYSGSFNLVSTFTKPDWLALNSPLDKLRYIAGRYVNYWDRMCCHPSVDIVDGTGEAPIVPLLTVGLAVVGILLALIHRRTPLVVLGTLIVLLMPFGAVVTVDGPARRTFALAPFLTLFVGIALVELVRLASTRGPAAAWIARGAVACLLVLTAYQNIWTYFVEFPGSEAERWVFALEATDAARYMASLPPGRHVYFLAGRWSVKYESVAFLAQNVTSEDRSNEFGHYSLDVDRTLGVPVFVLLGNYRSALADLQQRYPGGSVVIGGPPTDPTFVAYTDFTS